jgi:hypothetical protein
MSHPYYVNLEKVDEAAVVTYTGWPYMPEQKVSALFDMTSGWSGWRSCKLACGVQPHKFARPQQMKYFSVDDDPTLAEVFHDVSLPPGYDYFLLISTLPTTSEEFAERNGGDQLQFYHAMVKRYRGILSQSSEDGHQKLNFKAMLADLKRFT